MSFIINIPNNKRLIFIHIPKNGGMSMVKTLEILNPYRPYSSLLGHLTFLETEQILTHNNKDIYFCISRNPWDRMVSYYNYISQKKPDEHGVTDLHNKINSGMLFGEFVDIIIAEKRNIFRPQYEYMINSENNICVNVLSLEKINEDLQLFLNKQGLENKFSMTKINTSKHVHYSSFYDSNELIEKVAKFEKGIIDYHNYKFEKK